MCVRRLLSSSKTLVTASQAAAFTPSTIWIPVTGVTGLDVVMTITTCSGDIEVKPATQVTLVNPDSPDAPLVFVDGEYQCVTGHHHYRESVDASGKAYIRAGLSYRLRSGGSVQGNALVETRIYATRKGGVLGYKEFNLQTVTGEVSYFPLHDWSPTLNVDKVRAIFFVRGLNAPGALEYRLVGRTCVDEAAPNGWEAVEVGWATPAAANTERNTCDQSLPGSMGMASHQLFQLGVAVRRKAGGANDPRCQLSSGCFVKES